MFYLLLVGERNLTLVTTHVAFEGILVWLFMGKKNRELFQNKLWLFTGLTLFAAFPDLDAFIYIHRTYLHTVVWPLLIICGVLGYRAVIRMQHKEPLSEKALLITRSILLACVFLILHSLLDLNPGPVLLFYPFDNRLYSWNVSILWDLNSVLFIKGIHFSWSSVSLTEGLNAYPLFNLSPAERIQYFGAEFLEIFISDFPLHFLLGLSWLAFFPGRAIYAHFQGRPNVSAFFRKLNRLKSPLLSLGLLLLVFGLILGPGFQLHRTETRTTTTKLSFSETSAHYGFAQNFDLGKKSQLDVAGSYVGNTSTCKLALLISNQSLFQAYTSNITLTFERYFNGSYSYAWLVNSYRNLTQAFLGVSLQHQLIDYNRTANLSLPLESPATLTSAILLLDWNNSNPSFSVDIFLQNTLHLNRRGAFASGMVLASLGILLLAFILPQAISQIGQKPPENSA